MTADVGKSFVLATVPRITIVPGFIPPLVEPVGKVTEPPSAEILASPRKIVLPAIIKSFA
jgi:hypothetical protein